MKVKDSCSCSCNCGSDSSCSEGCVTNDATTGVYACAGASNVGVISFELTKALHLANKYKMGCSTCVGAGDCGCGGTVTLEGKKDLLIDGCKVACLRKMFEKKGITEFNHVIVTQLGVKKEPTFDFDPALIDALLSKLEQRGL
ncbi:MAG TPA: putative zinc-binding protein [Candidatus Cloacimonadota bacterium]|nr:putative zinc-binding protein [Candidatus Cloacimonadota bacterium]HPS37969.1 putative zinc-binding protein [Candidatus Cloacimonadota bacterium]